MNIAVIGTGYVGIVTGTIFAEQGNTVWCVDINEEKVALIKRGESPIYEPGLSELLTKNIKSKTFNVTTSLAEAMESAEIVFIAVGTPPAADGSADMTAVYTVAQEIGKNLHLPYTVIVDKSTVPVGTADTVTHLIQKELDARGEQLSFDVVSNPEFLKEGTAIKDCLYPDRVVIGAYSDKAFKVMEKLYAPVLRTNKPILFMKPRSAEMTKYAANSMLATRISFMNEIANLCDKVNADVHDVRLGMGSDSRIGYPFLFPGVGYGGSCFPKDVQALVQVAKENSSDALILNATEEVNARQKQVLAQKVISHFGGNLNGKHIAVWGLSFKPNTDDMREAPSIIIINELLKAGATVRAHDPVAIDNTKEILGDAIEYCSSRYETAEGADALCLITEWGDYKNMDFEKMKQQLREPVIFDGRNQYEPKEMKDAGFIYYCIGRPKA